MLIKMFTGEDEEYGQKAMVNLLVQFGANVSVCSNDDLITNKLLKAGIDPSFPDKGDYSLLRKMLLQESVKMVKVFVIKYILPKLCRISGPRKIVLHTYQDLIEFLINTVGLEEMNIPLRKYPSFVEFLIKNGDTKIFKGIAKEYDISVLLDTKNDYSQTLFHVAISRAKLEIIRFFVELGADVNGESPYGTMLEITTRLVTNKRNEVLELLLEKGADVNYRSNSCLNTLISNCLFESELFQSDNIQVLIILLKHGADVNARECWCLCTPFLRELSIDWHDPDDFFIKYHEQFTEAIKLFHTTVLMFIFSIEMISKMRRLLNCLRTFIRGKPKLGK